MKVLVVGSGGREHALCWAIAKSPVLEKLYCAPGNAGIAQVADCIDIGAEDVDAIVAWAKEEAPDLVVVGPEAPLVLGLVDALEDAGITTFGPSKQAAVLEGSKGFMKDMCAKAGVPTAAYGRFTDQESAKAFIRQNGAPIVVKTDGLAAGKGVIICQTVAEAEKAVDDMMENQIFGAAGSEIVIEEFLSGEECSFFALVDGERAVAMAAAQDHKAAYDGDKGPNTGGMGAYSPAPIATPDICDQIMETAITPLIETMAREGCPYKGVLFCGLMVENGVAKVLEYNIRFGDPECQVLMMRLESDCLEALHAAAQGRLDDIELSWSDETAMVVVMAAEGYPGSYEKGTLIQNLDVADALDGVSVFHAGTKQTDKGIVANGGRVLGVTGRAGSVQLTRDITYKAVESILWPEGFNRTDIGWRALERDGQP